MFFSGPKTSEAAKSSTASQRGAEPSLPYRPQTAPIRSSQNPDPNELIKLFRDKIRSRGIRGIIGLQKLFSIMDDDGTKSISLYEFSKACKDFKVGINEENVPLIFDIFDTNHDGTLNIDEFLLAIRGQMNDYRRSLVEQAFNKLDINRNGIIEIEDLKDLYNAKKHPDVVQGKKSEQQVLMDFIETFEIHHGIRIRDPRDNRITLEEFLEYYDNVSISIENDEYFALMINNSWNIKGDAYTYQKF
jgi:calcyphosin